MAASTRRKAEVITMEKASTLRRQQQQQQHHQQQQELEQNQPTATQATTQSFASNLWSQMESQPIENIVWGRLYGKNIKVKSLDLNMETFSAGRAESNNVIITLNDFPERILCRISKEHFTITKPNCDLANPVYIEDLSRNGTFVNSERIGMNNRRILQNDDIISLVHPSYKGEIFIHLYCSIELNNKLNSLSLAFVFKDLSPNEGIGIPPEITTNYYISRKLGSGACGLVRLVYDRRTCIQYAMKIVKKNMLATSAQVNHLNDPNRVLNEVEIMKNLQHPCVIKLHNIVDRPDSVYMVLEFMKGGDLLNRIISKKRLSEKISKLYFYQMCHAVKYLHDKGDMAVFLQETCFVTMIIYLGITHRDLKPDNVLLETVDDETLLKVSDFGLSKFVQKDSVMRTLCGTPLYVAPEVLLTGGRGAYTKKVDIWSLGVVLFTCLSGTLPFSDDYGTPASEQIKKGKFRFNHPSWRIVSHKAINLIRDMLIVNPERRPTISDVLKSNWLKDTQILNTANKLMNFEEIDVDDADNFIEPPRKRSRVYS